ncbi:unnamed protein product [Effrenium voratum]|uniref:Uncharacterized protein n=1 Tax=Effrenium voratum TaxID=2562239 RepID=A0AA36I1T2_9DINO|nr:unnamed protein product [Effrenium voratum]CAJ1379449.1 unnamed protein product [Effrenium voratum]CAJ1443983.1 unnamed protein product [Effrenium voratum]
MPELALAQPAIPEEPQQTPRRADIWKRNEKLVYLTNFLHMTLYTMCFGGIFDIFLYHLSQEQQDIFADAISVGANASPPIFEVNTYSNFELTFAIRPSRQASYPPTSNCSTVYTCATSILHVTDGSGNGDCCKVGNRIPFAYFANGTTYLRIAMDAVGQNETLDRRSYDQLQHCSAPKELPLHEWTNIKLKASAYGNSKGKIEHSDGGMVMFINDEKVCEVPGTVYHTLPSRQNARLFLGSLQSPPMRSHDLHLPAEAEIKDVKYGKPASNLFVGLANSAQGILSILIMYPIGWIGDKTNRYHLLRGNVLVAVLSGAAMLAAVYSLSLPLLFTGICIFTWYQQTISSTIYACLADNVIGERRTRAGVNYKTFSALAMSFGPAIQLVVVLWGPTEDSWTMSTFELLLLPGWLILPLIVLSVSLMVPVGKELSSIPNTDDAQDCPHSPIRKRISEAWLEQCVLGSLKRRFVVPLLVNVFFIATLLANGMTVRYFSLYFTQVLRFSPAQLCILNAVCRLFIAGFAQLGKPLSVLLGRCNLAVVLHIGSAIATLGIYGGGFFKPSVLVACACYLLRFACLHARDPVLYSITMDCVPQSQRSRWAALNSLRTLSFSASAVLGGFLADRHGYEYSFNVTIVSLLACTVIMLPAVLWFPKQEGTNYEESVGQAMQEDALISERRAVGEVQSAPSRPL